MCQVRDSCLIHQSSLLTRCHMQCSHYLWKPLVEENTSQLERLSFRCTECNCKRDSFLFKRVQRQGFVYHFVVQDYFWNICFLSAALFFLYNSNDFIGSVIFMTRFFPAKSSNQGKLKALFIDSQREQVYCVLLTVEQINLTHIKPIRGRQCHYVNIIYSIMEKVLFS